VSDRRRGKGKKVRKNVEKNHQGGGEKKKKGKEKTRPSTRGRETALRRIEKKEGADRGAFQQERRTCPTPPKGMKERKVPFREERPLFKNDAHRKKGGNTP